MFASLVPLVEDLATAKVNGLSKLVRGSYGIILIENDLMIGQGTYISSPTYELITQAILVLTMYKKGGGKYGCHSWTKECQNMGMFSYIVVQLWCQSLGQRCQFKTIHGPSSLCPHPFHFIHLCITHWFCLKKRTQHDIP